LIPSANNARTRSDAKIAEIAASIRAFGWANHILVDKNDGVFAGHGRLLATRKSVWGRALATSRLGQLLPKRGIAQHV